MIENSSPLGELLTVADVAQCLGVSKMTVYRLVNRRILPAHRFFRHLRFKPEDVQWCLQQHQLKSFDHYADEKN